LFHTRLCWEKEKGKGLGVFVDLARSFSLIDVLSVDIAHSLDLVFEQHSCTLPERHFTWLKERHTPYVGGCPHGCLFIFHEPVIPVGMAEKKKKKKK